MSTSWRRLCHRIDTLIKQRKEKYKISQKICLLANDGDRHFFKNVKNYQNKERLVPFDPMTLFPGLSEAEVAEELAKHFNAISHEFRPLNDDEIPETFSKPLPTLLPLLVAGRIRC